MQPVHYNDTIMIVLFKEQTKFKHEYGRSNSQNLYFWVKCLFNGNLGLNFRKSHFSCVSLAADL